MIHDSLTQKTVERYGAMHPLFSQAFDYLLTHFRDMSDSKMNGRHELIGDNLFVMISDHPLKEPRDAKLEVHDRYIDIQLVISGKEDFGWSDRKACAEPAGEMNAEKDIQFFEDSPGRVVTVMPKEFVVFFPEDAHAPLMKPVDACAGRMVRKAIVKVKVG